MLPQTKTPFELYGAEIGQGWMPLVTELLDKLKSIGWDGNILQIKEKFGGLRFYIDTGSDRAFDLIDEYENKSFSICEICGDPGKLIGHGWLMTRCEKHARDT